MAETPEPITSDDDETELLKEHGHPNAVAPKPGESDEDKEKAPVEEGAAAVSEVEPANGGSKAGAAATEQAGAVDDAVPARGDVTPPPTQAGVDPFVLAKQQIDQQIAALRAQKKAGEVDYDQANEQINDLVMKRQDLVDEHVTAQNQATQYWAGFTEEHGLSVATGKQLWKQAQTNMAAKNRLTQAAVETEYEHLLEKAKGAKPKPAPAKGEVVKPPTSAPIPGKAKLAPAPESGSNIPARAEKTDEEELLETVRKIPGGLRG